jgi:hypothetical protein
MAAAGKKHGFYPAVSVHFALASGSFVHVFHKNKPEAERDTEQDKGCGEIQPLADLDDSYGRSILTCVPDFRIFAMLNAMHKKNKN